MDENTILQGSVKAAYYNIILQVAFRFVTFPLNWLVLHNVDKDVLGILNVRLMLLITTIQSVSREAFRKSCISQTKDHNWPQVINLLWLGVPTAATCSFVFCFIWLHWLELPVEQYANDYTFAVYMTGISCVVESFVEPVYLFSQAFQYVGWRLFVDCLMILVKIGTLAMVVLYYPAYTIRAMAYGQLVVSTIPVVLYWFYFYTELRKKRKLVKSKKLPKNNSLLALPFDSLHNFMPQSIPGQTLIGYDLAALTWSFFKQGFLKQVLTEGERYIITVFDVISFAEQGVYDTVSILGSIAARVIFHPIEESSKFYFAQLLKRQIPVEQQPREKIESVASHLNTLLRFFILLGAIIVVFGFSFSHILLHIYGGDTLTNGPGPLLLKTQCLAVGFMGINGITEAYVSAAMNPQQLDRYNRLITLLSCIYLFLSWLLSSAFGGVGLILANCVNMVLRIAHSLRFIRNQYQNLPCNPLRGIIPSLMEGICLTFAFAVTAISSWAVYPESAMLHLGIGVISGLVVLGTILYEEPELMCFIIGHLPFKKFT